VSPPDITNATVMCMVGKVELARGDTVAIQGLGLLGI